MNKKDKCLEVEYCLGDLFFTKAIRMLIGKVLSLFIFILLVLKVQKFISN